MFIKDYKGFLNGIYLVMKIDTKKYIHLGIDK